MTKHNICKVTMDKSSIKIDWICSISCCDYKQKNHTKEF